MDDATYREDFYKVNDLARATAREICKDYEKTCCERVSLIYQKTNVKMPSGSADLAETFGAAPVIPKGISNDVLDCNEGSPGSWRSGKQ